MASVVARGTRVLARRDEDGYYYIAHIAQDVSVSNGLFHDINVLFKAVKSVVVVSSSLHIQCPNLTFEHFKLVLSLGISRM